MEWFGSNLTGPENNSKPLCIGGVQDILYAPETQLT